MSQGPLVIVGQARSGSTLVTRLLADTLHFLLVNDAYVLQFIDDIDPPGEFTQTEAHAIADYCFDMLRKRAITREVNTIDRSVPLEPHEIDALRPDIAALLSQLKTPEDVVTMVLQTAAKRTGASIWGWNSPPDYLNVERILRRFQGARILFLIRNPYNVLKSYKYAPDYWQYGRFRYHPVLQSLVWRQVVREYRRLSGLYPDAVRIIRYEDIIASGTDVWGDLQGFLGNFPVPLPADRYGNNSSFRNGRSRSITRLEVEICRVVTGPHLADYGYDKVNPKIAGAGVIDLVTTSFRCLSYYFYHAVRSRDMRQRIKRLGASVLSGIGYRFLRK